MWFYIQINCDIWPHNLYYTTNTNPMNGTVRGPGCFSDDPVVCSLISSHHQESGVSCLICSKRCTQCLMMTYCCNPKGWTDSGRSVLSYSDHIGDPPHWLCTDRNLSCPHTGPRPLSLQVHKYILGPPDVHHKCHEWDIGIFKFSFSCLRMHASDWSIRLRGLGWYPGAQRSHFGPVVWCIQLSHTPPLVVPLASYSSGSKWQRWAWLLHSQPENTTV